MLHSNSEIELSPVAGPSRLSSPPMTPGRLRKSGALTRPPKTPSLNKKKNPRWEGQADVPVFDLLPDELVIRIHSYLDVPTIGLTAQLSSRFNEIAQDVPLWRDLSGRGNWDNKKNMPQQVTRSFYVRKFISFRRDEKLKEELAEQQKRREKRDEDIYRSALGLLWLLFARPYEWICTVAVILFTVFVVLKLDKLADGQLGMPWGVVFIPLIIICYQMLFAPLVYDILRTLYACDFEEELAPEKFMRPIFFFLFFLMPLQSGRMLNRILVFTPIATLLTFFVLLLIRITGHASIPWWGVVLPLLLFALYLTILPLVVQEPVWNDNKWIDHVLPCIGGSLVLLFVLLLAVKLEDKAEGMTWFHVMIPLFVLKGLFVIATACLTFFSHFCCSFWLEDRSRWPNDTASYCIVATAVILVVIGPLLAFEILLAQKLENERHSNFSLIFVPLFLLEAFGVCGCCALNLVVLFE